MSQPTDQVNPWGSHDRAEGGIDPALQTIIDAWPHLDDAARRTILGVVREAARG